MQFDINQQINISHVLFQAITFKNYKAFVCIDYYQKDERVKRGNLSIIWRSFCYILNKVLLTSTLYSPFVYFSICPRRAALCLHLQYSTYVKRT